MALVIAGPAFAGDDDAAKTSTKPVTSASAPASTPSPAPVPPPPSSGSSYSWTGFYVGANIGYGQGRADTSFNPLPSAASFVNLKPQTLPLHTNGVLGGGQFGYDRQHGNWVWGLATDFSGTGMQRATRVSPIIQNNGTPFPGSGFLAANSSTPWLGTARGRFGIVADKRMLFYATGGLAYGHVNMGADTDFLPPGSEDYLAKLSRTKIGWTVGGGIQYGAWTHWNMGFEYLYVTLRNEALTVNGNPVDPPFQVAYNWGARSQIVRFMLNYKF